MRNGIFSVVPFGVEGRKERMVTVIIFIFSTSFKMCLHQLSYLMLSEQWIEFWSSLHH